MFDLKQKERYKLLSVFYIVLAKLCERENVMNKAQNALEAGRAPLEVFSEIEQEVKKVFEEINAPSSKHEELKNMILKNILVDVCYREID